MKNSYQYALIGCALLVIVGIGLFVYHELCPAYKTYQCAYEDLEKFRSTYTHEKPAPFTKGIKQIVRPNPTGGPEIIDRCASCHIAMDLPHFSPTRLAVDVNGSQVYDNEGNPVLESNPDYVWSHVDDEILELRNEDVNAQLQKSEVSRRLAAADKLEAFKSMEKVIQMHPLMPGETRPFEFHPMSEYGCTSCHSGNGRALVVGRAHGPLYDDDYDIHHAGAKPQFTEVDKENDPPFARMYNNKPGHDLAFQTTPLLSGPLMVASCVQCHQSASGEAAAALDKFSHLATYKERELAALQKGLENEKRSLETLLSLRSLVEERGREGTIEWLQEQVKTGFLSSEQIKALKGQLNYLNEHEEAAFAIEKDIEVLLEGHSIESKQEAIAQTQALLSRVEEPLKLAQVNKQLTQWHLTGWMWRKKFLKTISERSTSLLG